MNTANLNYGKLINIKEKDKDKYEYYYTAESEYICCYRKGGLNYA